MPRPMATACRNGTTGLTEEGWSLIPTSAACFFTSALRLNEDRQRHVFAGKVRVGSSVGSGPCAGVEVRSSVRNSIASPTEGCRLTALQSACMNFIALKIDLSQASPRHIWIHKKANPAYEDSASAQAVHPARRRLRTIICLLGLAVPQICRPPSHNVLVEADKGCTSDSGCYVGYVEV